MDLKALLFDVDGTLADTEAHGHLPAYNKAFRDLELDWNWSEQTYRSLLALPGGRERIAHYINHYKPALGACRADNDMQREEWVRSIHERKSQHFRKRLEDGQIPLRAGVERLLSQAPEAGLQVAIVSNASRATLEPFLQHALGDRLCSHIATIIGGEQVVHKKPAPDVYRKACRVLGCRPRECVAIEDSAMGLEAAHAASIVTVVTVNSNTDMHRLDQADLVVDSLGEPDAPVTVLKSPGFALEHVDIDVLQRLHAAHAVACMPAATRAEG